MKKRIAVVLALLVGSYAVGAHAGARIMGDLAYAFFISGGATRDTAAGAVGATRDSPDRNGQIWCSIHGTTSALTGTCTSCDSVSGACLSCTSSDSNILTVIQSVSATSQIAFTNDLNGDHVCGQVVNNVGSPWAPKK